MALQTYRETMEHLSQILSYKLKTNVLFSTNTIQDLSNERWFFRENQTIFPLSLNLTPLGYLHVDGKIQGEELKEVDHLIQWTLFSLEEIFDKNNVKIFINNDLDPLLIYDLKDKTALDIAYDIYESSPMQFFICHNESSLRRSLFSSELKNTMIFIYDIFALNYEDQVFLSQYLKNRTKGPIILGSIKFYSNSNALKSLLDCFLPFKHKSIDSRIELNMDNTLKFYS